MDLYFQNIEISFLHILSNHFFYNHNLPNIYLSGHTITYNFKKQRQILTINHACFIVADYLILNIQQYKILSEKHIQTPPTQLSQFKCKKHVLAKHTYI